MSGEGQFKIDPSYNEVPQRIRDFREKHPEGSLRAANPNEPFKIVVIGNQTYIAYTAAAFRHPEDPAPGIGCAWELVPGKTPYTRDSELQNAETSAWGRALVAVLAADAKKIATQEDVELSRARQAERTENQKVRRQIADFAKEHGWDIAALSSEFEGDYGMPTAQASADDLRDFMDVLRARAEGAVALPPEPDVTGGEAHGEGAGPSVPQAGGGGAPPTAPPAPHEFRSSADASGTCRIAGCGQVPSDPIHVEPGAEFFRDSLVAPDIDKAEVKRLMRQLEMKGLGEVEVVGANGVTCLLRDLAATRLREVPA